MGEIDDRFHDELLVVDLVVVEPVAIIIFGQITQEGKQFCRESVECLHCTILSSMSCSLNLIGRHLVAGHGHLSCAISHRD